ncbi:DNA-3-methyladenine glycosylase [Mucisphaera sp.]|uniref:DNA-3-methyladenine glycosylase n=1 Tax=Mucisphaera sp. TaxID=2913024 RepID=UPI003D13716C
MPDRLPRAFYQQPAERLARELIGQRLVRSTDGQHRLSGVIVETEAYLGVIDAAAHTYEGRRTARNEAMYADAGHAYVYFTYGMHHCFNIVAATVDDPQAVLIRALEPSEGLADMRSRRRAARVDRDLTSGPAKLCSALAIGRDLNGIDLTTYKGLWLEEAESYLDDAIMRTPRIGIDYAGDWVDRPLRFCVRDHPCLSRK